MIQIFALLLTLFSSPAMAQCTGQFAGVTVCGNAGSSTAQPKPTPWSSFPSSTFLTMGTGLGLQTTQDEQNTAALPNTAVQNGGAPVWKRIGTVLQGSQTNCGTSDGKNFINEHALLNEGSPKILTTQTTVFKMWFHAGFSTNNTNYAESADGISWTCYSGNPVITNTTETHSIVKSGSTYILYPKNTVSGCIDRYTSLDGLAWTLANSSILCAGPGWDAGFIGNAFVWSESPTVWKMLYTGGANASSLETGLATSSDGITWTKSGSNPVVTDLGTGGPFVYKALSGTYYYWTQAQFSRPITDIYRYTSSNLTSWTRTPSECVFCRGVPDEWPATTSGALGSS